MTNHNSLELNIVSDSQAFLLNIDLMKMSDRSRRLAGTMEHLLPEIMRPLIDPDKMGFVTVTAIEVSGDLGLVDVFVRSLGGPASYLKELKRMEKKIGHLLLQKLELRRAFILRFKPDQSVNAVEKLKKLGL
ncbi:ribosome-binding factor A [bacterium]|nr:ribosome-binding factor A [bacterium]NCQ54919.1 ribosome-binding factor A [Candidatus Parcubacteria bacterium]NCS66963.1 ribosome-binding factor A [Candidatus Peregrinibacteria bacterium]NCS95909.1 ribosome-binding factor A [bacterium]